MVDLDLAVWAHRWSDLYPKVIGSIARYVRQSYNLIVVAEPGSCHRNMQRVLDRSKGRFLCFFDEDVELLDEYTIPRLVQAVSHSSIAIAAPLQIYSQNTEILSEYRHLMKAKGPPSQEGVITNWCAAYCMMVDRHKVPDLYADQDIPWIKGMTDVDMSHQARKAGFNCVIDRSVAVLHADKATWTGEMFEKYQCPPNDGTYLREHKPKQNAYMQEKWGDFWSPRKPAREGVMDEVPRW